MAQHRSQLCWQFGAAQGSFLYTCTKMVFSQSRRLHIPNASPDMPKTNVLRKRSRFKQLFLLSSVPPTSPLLPHTYCHSLHWVLRPLLSFLWAPQKSPLHKYSWVNNTFIQSVSGTGKSSTSKITRNYMTYVDPFLVGSLIWLDMTRLHVRTQILGLPVNVTALTW